MFYLSTTMTFVFRETKVFYVKLKSLFISEKPFYSKFHTLILLSPKELH
jgi:hypothetical protein